MSVISSLPIVAVLVASYVFVLATSGFVVNRALAYIDRTVGESDVETNNQKSDLTDADRDLGVVIGKCENALVLTFILLEAYTGLAIIFSAKNIVRIEDIEKNTQYYLGGTLVNFTYSVLVGATVLGVLSLPLSANVAGASAYWCVAVLFTVVSIVAIGARFRGVQRE